MPEAYALKKFNDATPAVIEAALEQSDVVFFERWPSRLAGRRTESRWTRVSPTVVSAGW